VNNEQKQLPCAGHIIFSWC